jgi:hypothetical protein
MLRGGAEAVTSRVGCDGLTAEVSMPIADCTQFSLIDPTLLFGERLRRRNQ